MSLILRDYQQEKMLQPLRESFRAGNKAPLLVAPTASGKTAVFCRIAMDGALRGNRVLILVHRKELWAQTSDTLLKYGAPHGVIARGQSFRPEMIQVASVQTLVRRLDKLPWRPDLIVVDEGHHAVRGSTYSKIIEYYGTPPMILVTATPERLDGRGLGVAAGGFADDLVIGPTPSELIKAGYLCPPEVYGAPVKPDMTGIHTRGGDWAKDELSDLMSTPKLVGNAVDHYRRLAPGEPAIVFCASVKHAEITAQEFQKAGFNFVSIDGKTNAEDRKNRIEGLASGQLHGLTSCDIISEGTDVPVVSVAILLRPTKSLALYLQQVGRALRISEGKTRSLILDHAGNWEYHGFPDDNRTWTLEGRDKKKKVTKNKEANKQCPECYKVHPPCPACPQCGYVYAKSPREILQVEGTLERVDPQAARQENKKARNYDEFFDLAIKRGYKNPMAFATKQMAARAKSKEDLIDLGIKTGKKNPEGWAQFMWVKVVLPARYRKKAA